MIRPSEFSRRDVVAAVAMACVSRGLAAAPPNSSKIVYAGADGRLVYVADAQGNRIPDFSNCGYRGGGVPVPDVPVRATVKPGSASEDATERIQRAIDEVSRRNPDEAGFRGAVLLPRGRYSVGGTLRISTGGVVLRGEGSGEDGTVIVATGGRRPALIEIRGAYAQPGGVIGAVGDEYVPVGSRTLRVSSAGRLRPGDTVIVRRKSNSAWIRELGMDRIKPRPNDPGSTVQWKPFELDFERRVEAVDARRVTLDAPITCAIETRWGGGEVLAFDDAVRVRRAGIENLRGISQFDRAVKSEHRGRTYHSDEQHAWSLIAIESANDIWVRNVAARHFGYACVEMRRSRHVTVQDCDNAEMVSEITGSRRYSFSVNGQLCLVRRCASDSGRHDFVVGARICGPNVFLECKAGVAYASSEPHHRWSVGGLYDNVSAPIAIQDRQYYGTGHGWSGANYVVWNCTGPLVCQKPPTAQNWAIGHVGVKEEGAFASREDGYWESLGRHVVPASLYVKQLEDRLS